MPLTPIFADCVNNHNLFLNYGVQIISIVLLSSQGTVNGFCNFCTSLRIGVCALFLIFIKNLSPSNSTLPGNLMNFLNIVGDKLFSNLLKSCAKIWYIESRFISQNNCSIILNQNYPNPFSTATTVGFTLHNSGHINLCIYNNQGELVSDLINGYYPPDNYNIKWNVKNLPAGLYICRLQYKDNVLTKKMNLIK